MATIKQIKASNILLDNPSLSMRQVMKQAGYSDNSAIAPTKNLLSSPSFMLLLDKHIPEALASKKHKQLLNKREYKRVFNHATGEYETVKTKEIDANAVSKGLDMYYKIKGTYAPEKREVLTSSLSEYLKAISKRREAETISQETHDVDL